MTPRYLVITIDDSRLTIPANLLGCKHYYSPLPTHGSPLTNFPSYLCPMDVRFHLKDIHIVARQFWSEMEGKKVFAFHGEMGAGKTTFIHALCDEKKVSSTVGSPTFSLINEYRYPQGLMYHIDLYRIRDEEEAIRSGMEDCLYSGELCLVEWPEKAPGIFPDDTVHVYLKAIDNWNRQIRV